ncbi:MAG: hypothetical protein JWQ71_3619 [Pedosphaera sp.]|nr:hypothetical protein [Pedosphaera sp.]
MTDHNTITAREGQIITREELREMLADANLLADQREAVEALLQHTVDVKN